MLTPLVERSALESPLLEAAVAASPLHTAERVRESVCVHRGGCVCQQWSDGYCKLRGYTRVYKQQGTLHISQTVPPASTKHAQLPPTTIIPVRAPNHYTPLPAAWLQRYRHCLRPTVSDLQPPPGSAWQAQPRQSCRCLF